MAKPARPSRGSPAAAGGPLLDLDRSRVLSAWLFGKRHGQVGGETEDHVFVVPQAAGHRERVEGQAAAPVVVVGEALGDGTLVAMPSPGERLLGQGGLPAARAACAAW